jgi:hypothetical protein
VGVGILGDLACVEFGFMQECVDCIKPNWRKCIKPNWERGMKRGTEGGKCGDLDRIKKIFQDLQDWGGGGGIAVLTG